MSALRVEAVTSTSGNWHYRVPALHINGGGTPTREAAERDCLSAIAFALEGDPQDYDTDAETLTLRSTSRRQPEQNQTPPQLPAAFPNSVLPAANPCVCEARPVRTYAG